MLQYLGENVIAAKIQAALEKVYTGRVCLTKDVGGTASTNQFADAVIAAL